MRILDNLREKLEVEDSMFRAQLMREDIARLQRLFELAQESSDCAAFQRAGLYIGWTQNDALTHRIKEPLERLLSVFYARVVDPGGEVHEEALDRAWQELEQARLQRLIKCL